MTILAIALVLLIPMFTFAIFSYVLFWYEAANSPYRTYVERLARGRVPLLLLKGVFWSVLSQLLSVLVYPLHFAGRLWNPSPDHTSPFPVVLFVHGLYHNPSAWIAYRHWFRKAGYTNLYAWKCLLWKYSFTELLSLLEQWVQEVSSRFPHKPIILIGHSIGGLLIRAYVESPVALKTVSAVVTLGAPHQGTKISVLGISKASWALQYRGALIQQIENTASPCRIVRLGLYSPIDNVVLPIDAVRASARDWQYLETRPVSHIAMLFHKPTAMQIIEFLRQHPVPAEPEC